VRVGDLVRWTHPDDEGVGLILEVISQPTKLVTGEAVIMWSPSKKQPEGHTGCYPARHHYMEVISESR
jgi:hypothetical protein